MTLSLEDLDLLATPGDILAGVPMQLPLDVIDEDPDQPRTEFDPEALAELAETIKDRGVRQPISVRRHPEKPGRWMLNFGARRLRASKLAGKHDIPAFVDNTMDNYDQVIENEQRDSLKPLELALFVQRRKSLGENQADIAKRLGKSRGYVTFICALVDAPDWLMDLYRSGRCRGIAELYELRRLHQTEPDTVERWLKKGGLVTRADVQYLKDGRQSGVASSAPSSSSPETLTPSPAPALIPMPPTVVIAASPPTRALTAPALATINSHPSPVETRQAELTPTAPARALRVAADHACIATLWGTCDGADVTIDLTAVPDEAGHVFILRDGEGERSAVPASRVRLQRVVHAVFNG